MKSKYAIRKKLKQAKEELNMAENRFKTFIERKYEKGAQYAQSDMIIYQREIATLEWILDKKKKV